MWKPGRATCSSMSMRKTVILLLLLLLLALWAERSHELTSQEKNKKGGVLTRSKRRWVLSTIELEEELPGPYPKRFTEFHNDKHLNHSIIFKISGQGVTEEPKDVFSINKNTGELFIHKPIDRETYSILSVRFDVLDKGTHTVVDKTLALNVVIKDKNDNPPKFIPEVLNINIPENTKEGQFPFSLQARDIDEVGTDNSRVSMRIVSQEPALPKISLDFLDEKDSSITKLVFTGCFDYDKVKKYKLLVEARDYGTPSLSSTGTVNIYITDSNTHAPVFTAPKFNAQVMEMESNKDILRIPVQDLDTPNTPGTRVVFTILKGNEEGNYKIETDPLTNEGVLTVIKAKDYEDTTLTKLEIGVENEEPLFFCVDGKPVSPVPGTLKRNTVKVAVTVIDVNDPPVFSNKIHTVYRVEEEEPGGVLYIPTVTDEDSNSANIRYELVEDPANWLSIDPQTGKLTLAKKMDRESPYVHNNTYSVVMHAIDDAEPPGTGTGTLVVRLGDKNDNAPYLTCNPSVICGNKAGRLRVTAKDVDDYPYSGPFTYSLGEGTDQELKNVWTFEQTMSETFLISLNSLPYGNYTIPLTIADQQGVQAHEVLQVVVCDCGNGTVCNDLLPRFSTLHGAAIGILLGALILMSLLMLLGFSCKNKRKDFKPFVEDDGNPTLIKYNEEGLPLECPLIHFPLLNTELTEFQHDITHSFGNMNMNAVQRPPKYTQSPTGQFPGLNTELNTEWDGTYSTTKNRLSRPCIPMSGDNIINHMERKLGQLAMDEVCFPEHQPHCYDSEGNITNSASLDKLSFYNTEKKELDFLQNMGLKFAPWVTSFSKE